MIILHTHTKTSLYVQWVGRRRDGPARTDEKDHILFLHSGRRSCVRLYALLTAQVHLYIYIYIYNILIHLPGPPRISCVCIYTQV